MKVRGLLCTIATSFGCLGVGTVAADGQFTLGHYVRISKSPVKRSGGRESGVLNLLGTSDGKVTFRLEATANFVPGDGGSNTHVGVIENAHMFVSNSHGFFRDASGKCVLRFTSKGSAIVVAQSGQCDGFGDGVDASGLYRRSNTAER